MKRRERSLLTMADAHAAVKAFAAKVVRWGESSDSSMFTGPGVEGPAFGPGYINVQFMVKGSFGTADDLFEAMRVLRGTKLPRIEGHTAKD